MTFRLLARMLYGETREKSECSQVGVKPITFRLLAGCFTHGETQERSEKSSIAF